MLQFELHVPWALSLKDKRRVVRSVKDRLHREHQVSVAEVAAQDCHTLAVLGLAVVAADGARVGQILDRVSEKLRSIPDAELGKIMREILHGEQIKQHHDESHASSALLDQDVLEMARHAEAVLR